MTFPVAATADDGSHHYQHHRPVLNLARPSRRSLTDKKKKEKILAEPCCWLLFYSAARPGHADAGGHSGRPTEQSRTISGWEIDTGTAWLMTSGAVGAVRGAVRFLCGVCVSRHYRSCLYFSCDIDHHESNVIQEPTAAAYSNLFFTDIFFIFQKRKNSCLLFCLFYFK